MSEQGLEVLDSTYHKTQEWIGQLAENSHLEKGDAYKALRAVLLTLRDCLPIQEAVHFGAQLPMLIRGLYYDGWKPSETPIKMSREQFLEAIKEKIVTDRFMDPVRMTHDVVVLLQDHMSPGEMSNVKQILPKELRTLLPDSANQNGAGNMATANQKRAARKNIQGCENCEEEAHRGAFAEAHSHCASQRRCQGSEKETLSRVLGHYLRRRRADIEKRDQRR